MRERIVGKETTLHKAIEKVHPMSPDSVTADPTHYKVEFESERVRVVRIRYDPHEKSMMHSHPGLVAVYLTDCHLKFTYPDGKDGRYPGESRRHLAARGDGTSARECRRNTLRGHCRGAKEMT